LGQVTERHPCRRGHLAQRTALPLASATKDVTDLTPKNHHGAPLLSSAFACCCTTTVPCRTDRCALGGARWSGTGPSRARPGRRPRPLERTCLHHHPVQRRRRWFCSEGSVTNVKQHRAPVPDVA